MFLELPLGGTIHRRINLAVYSNSVQNVKIQLTKHSGWAEDLAHLWGLDLVFEEDDKDHRLCFRSLLYSYRGQVCGL